MGLKEQSQTRESVTPIDLSTSPYPMYQKQDLNRLRNALHNEAGITKEEIREMVEAAVEHLVDKRVKQLLPDEVTMDNLVDKAVKSRSLYWLSKEEAFDDRIVDKVAKLLASKVKIKVEVKTGK